MQVTRPIDAATYLTLRKRMETLLADPSVEVEGSPTHRALVTCITAFREAHTLRVLTSLLHKHSHTMPLVNPAAPDLQHLSCWIKALRRWLR